MLQDQEAIYGHCKQMGINTPLAIGVDYLI